LRRVKQSSSRARALLALGILGVALVASAARASAAETGSRRALWVLAEGSQRVLENPDRVELLLADAQALGASELFVQVLRGGRAWFDSSHADAAPFAAARAANDGRDPLAMLIERAAARGLWVHAWVNVLSLAANAEAPIVAKLGRESVIVDQRGRSLLDYPSFEVPAPDRAYYRMGTPAVWLDPAAPGVAEELTATLAQLVKRYPRLAGVHLDYVRYADALPFVPGSRFGVGLSFGYGAASRARFQSETGLEAPFGASLANADAWDRWRRKQLSLLVARIASATRAVRPGLAISAAVIPDPERAWSVDLQDWRGWIDTGALDFAVPMHYTRDPERFRYGLEILAGLAERRPLWIGLGAWLFTGAPPDLTAQVAEVAANPRLGIALFSWDALREQPELLSALATARLEATAAAAAAP
jgi:uncharacterized lipoprotein YddW (UPF0748 family)